MIQRSAYSSASAPVASTSEASYLVETDVLAGYLTAERGDDSLLRQALRRSICYTTMLNALELFRAARTEEEQRVVLRLLHIVRVLGFNSRYAEQFATLARTIENATGHMISDRDAMILGMAQVSKLTILSVRHFARYAHVQSALQDSTLAPVRIQNAVV